MTRCVCMLCCVVLCCAVVRYSAGASASILWSAGVKTKGEVAAVMSRLEAAGMPTLDISNMEAARVRHTGGGGRGLMVGTENRVHCSTRHNN